MSSFDYIDEQTDILFEEFPEYVVTDPFKLMRVLDINYRFDDLGEVIMGYNSQASRIPIIILNSRMDDLESQAVAYHELGHNRMHKGFNTNFYKRVDSPLMVSGIESEANVFMFQMLFKHRDYVRPNNHLELLRAYNLSSWMDFYFGKLNLQ